MHHADPPDPQEQRTTGPAWGDDAWAATGDGAPDRGAVPPGVSPQRGPVPPDVSPQRGAVSRGVSPQHGPVPPDVSPQRGAVSRGVSSPVPAGPRAFEAVAAAESPTDAAGSTARVLAASGPVEAFVLLRRRNQLRSFASAGGGWRIYSSVPLDAGAVGLAFRTGRTVVDHRVNALTSSYPIGPLAITVMCIPVVGADGVTLGILKLEWEQPADLPAWQAVAETAADALGARLTALRYDTTEGPRERVARHAYDIARAADQRDMATATLRAARDVTGLSTAVGIRIPPDSVPTLLTEHDHSSILARRMRGLTGTELAEIAVHTHRHGTWYATGQLSHPTVDGLRSLTAIGARTVVSVPLGDSNPDPVHRTLLVLDEAVRQPTAEMITLLELLAAQARLWHDRASLVETLRERATRDPLTGLGHQATFAERMTAAEPGRTALLLIDIDNFKEINDTRGHAVGDRVLTELSRVLRATLRPEDDLYRIGGDEFVAVLDTHRTTSVRGVAERLVNAANRVGSSVSLGASVMAPDETPEQALRRADQAMYLVKRSGGDGLRLAAQPPALPVLDGWVGRATDPVRDRDDRPADLTPDGDDRPADLTPDRDDRPADLTPDRDDRPAT